ncbi:MAG: sugar ABC transporter substrate-binding protein [Caldilineaceae bacterium]|nr:sugar ABC transporter substrate-binding protein [Caldilineaceae bacterium]
MLHRFFLAATLVLLLATACQPIQPTAQSSPSAAQLTFLISGDPTDEVAYQELIDAFAAQHADITVNLINIPSGGDFRKRLAADFAAGTPPDLFLINYRHLGRFLASGAVEPLTAYLEASTLIKTSDYYAQALAAFQWAGEQFCMPQNMSSPVIYYNKALFDAAGVAYPSDSWDWDEFVATAQALTQDEDGDGIVDVYGYGTEATLVRLAPFIWMNGGDLVDDPAAPTKLALDTPASKAALTWFVELQTVHQVTPDAVAEEAESSLSRFVNGRMAMFIDSRRAVPEFRLIEAFDWDVAGLPQAETQASILHSDAFCIAAASKAKAAAWTFVEFANAEEGQIILAKTGRTVPSRIALAESPVFLDPAVKPANNQAFLDAIPGIRNLPIMATWSDIESIVNTELNNAFYGRATVDEALQAANDHSAEFFAP